MAKETAMSTSLARKIRRIGLRRKLVSETVLVLDEQGKEIEFTAQVPVTRRENLSIDDLAARRSAVISAWRAKRKKNRRSS
jgi:hypothetical protein